MEFEPPGPGVWEQDPAHFEHPLSHWMQSVYPAAFTRGWEQAGDRYGMLVERVEMKPVHGLPYTCVRMAGAPESASGPPPAIVLWLLSRLHPEMRRRNRRMREVFETRAWRDDVGRWDEEWKPAIQRRYTALQEVEPSDLDDDALLDHLETCRDEVHASTVLHHTLNPVWMLPTGDFLVQAGEWTDATPGELLTLLTGSAPISVGANDALQALAKGLAEHPVDLEGPPEQVLDRLCQAPVPVGPAARTYLDAVGWRILGGYDVAAPVVREQPAMLVGSVRAVLDGAGPSVQDRREAEARIRSQVPSRHRDAFDDLLAEARATYRIRDERCQLNDAWVYGLSRRALLAAGERLQMRGCLHEADHAVDLHPDELQRLLTGGSGPSPRQIARRVEHRRTTHCADAPDALGGEASGPPPAGALPAPTARAMRAFGAMIEHCLKEPEAKGESELEVEGLPAHPGVVEGTVRRVLDPDELDRVRPGDVLVARWTTPAYTAALPLLAAIVTDRGGVLSHAAIVAREYGIPSVVGCVRATDVLQDGARVRVDGGQGVVRVLAA